MKRRRTWFVSVSLTLIISLLVALVLPQVADFGSKTASADEVSLTEKIWLRTKNSKVFYSQDTLPQREYHDIYMDAVHYEAGYERLIWVDNVTQETVYWTMWEDIDNTLEPAGELSPWDWQMLKADYHVYILEDFTYGQILKFEKADPWDNVLGDVAFQPMALQWTNDLDQIQGISMPQTGNLTVVDNEIRWNNAYGANIDFSWSCYSTRLVKLLEISSLSDLPFPEQFIINGGNPVLELNLIFDSSSGLDIYIDGNIWVPSKPTTDTFGVIEFKSGSEVLWGFMPLRAWDSNGYEINVLQRVRKVGNKLYVSARIPYWWIQGVTYPIHIDAVVDEWVEASSDDANELVSDGSMDLTDITIDLGSYQNPKHSGYRYRGIDTIDVEHVDVAYLEFYPAESDSGDVSYTWYGENTGNATTFTSSAYDISNRPRTSASINENPPADWTQDIPVQTADLSDILNEIFNSENWTSGNDLAILTIYNSGNGERRLRSWDYNDHSKAPKLHFENPTNYVTYYWWQAVTPAWTDYTNMVDGSLSTYGYTATDGNTQELNSLNTTGDDLGWIEKVEIRLYGYGDGDDRIDVTMEYSGDSGDEQQITMPSSPGWCSYVDITNDTNAPDIEDWWWTIQYAIDTYLEYDKVKGGSTMYCAMKELRITYEPYPSASVPDISYNVTFEYEYTSNLTPVFHFSSVDQNSTDNIHYEINIDTDHDFSTPISVNATTTDNASMFANLDTPADTPPFNEGDKIQFTSSSLTNNTVYYWRVRARTSAETSWSEWVEMDGKFHYTEYLSVSTNTSLTDSRWFQTADEQFDTGNLANTQASGGSVSITNLGGAPNRIDFETGTAASGTTVNVDNVTVSGTDRALYCFVTFHDSGIPAVCTSVEWKSGGAAQSFTQIGYANQDADAVCYAWRLVNPSTGTDTVYVTLDDSSYAGICAAVISLTNVNQSTPNGTVATANDMDNIIELVVESGGSDRVIYGAMASESNTDWGPTDPENELWYVDINDHYSHGIEAIGASPNETISWWNEGGSPGTRLAACGFSVNPSAASGGSGIITSRAIDFDWLSGAGDWGQLVFSDNETVGDIKYDIEYWTGSNWTDTAIVNQDTSPVDISSLDPTTHNRIRISGNLTDTGGGGSVTQEDLETATISSGTTLNIPNVTVTGTNKALYVFVTWNAGSGLGVPTSVNWRSGGDEQSLTEIGSAINSDDAACELWRLVNPSSATDTVYITFDVSVANGAAGAAISLSGVDQSTPNDTVAESTADAADFDLTVNGDSGDTYYAACGAEYGTLTSDEPALEIWNLAPNSHLSSGNKYVDGSSKTFGWGTGNSGSHFAGVGCAVNPAGGSPILYDWKITWTECSPDITNTPDFYDFGIVSLSSNYTTGSYFTLVNDSGGDVTVTIQGTNAVGGTPWTLSDTATRGSDIYGLMAGVSDNTSYESQMLESAAHLFVYDDDYVAQSFNSTTPHEITSVSLSLQRWNPSLGDFIVEIVESLNGDTLATGNISASAISESGSAMYNVSFSLTTLIESNQLYYIIAKYPSGNSTNNIRVWYRTGNPYAKGTVWTTTNGGDNWTQESDYDLKFTEYGFEHDVIVKLNSPYNNLTSGLPHSSNITWGLLMLTPSFYSDGLEKSANVTLTATCD